MVVVETGEVIAAVGEDMDVTDKNGLRMDGWQVVIPRSQGNR
jgi:hypothetical protein